MLQVTPSPWDVSPRIRRHMIEEGGAATMFYGTPQVQRRQQRFEFKTYRDPAIRQHLLGLFHGKCAYCESPLDGAGAADLEHYRPKSGVLEDKAHPGYWWLALEWFNLLIACRACGSAKRNRFPLHDDATRAFGPGDDIGAEAPLLLNPYTDAPDAHLLFDDAGLAAGITEEGRVTIAVLDLNRPGLVEARRASAAQAEKLVRLMEASNGELHTRLAGSLVDMAAPEHAYAGANRQVIGRLLGRFDIALPAVPWEWPSAAPHAARAGQQRFETQQATYSLDTASGRRRYQLQSRFIEHIAIDNVRAIRQLELPMTRGPADSGTWMVLLGENGTAKSTVLRAVAAVLAGPEACAALMEQGLLVPRDFIRQRCKSGRAAVKLSGFPQPHTLTFTSDALHFVSGTGEETKLTLKGKRVVRTGRVMAPPTVLLGYGATRLAARRDAGPGPGQRDPVRIANLFDPFTTLLDANAWLMELDIRTFSKVALMLQDLLCLPSTARLRRRDGKVQVSLHGDWMALDQLSDGYQGTIALAADVMRTAMTFWPSPADAEGIVLLDEIGIHLHPRWQMRIVGSLRRALPGMQFIVTTHEPLCLRGVGQGEVTAMERDANGEIEAIGDLPSPADYRVEQLLTSQFFGLSSTSDPETERLFDEYYTLLALTRPDRAQAQRLTELKAELKDRAHFGDTMREQRMYELVDKELTRERQRGALRLPKTSAAERNTVTALWQDAIKQARGGS